MKKKKKSPRDTYRCRLQWWWWWSGNVAFALVVDDEPIKNSISYWSEGTKGV